VPKGGAKTTPYGYSGVAPMEPLGVVKTTPIGGLDFVGDRRWFHGWESKDVKDVFRSAAK
jgi:hypothetical protein